MTANDIRNELARESQHMFREIRLIHQVLCEIAAQLAELNEHIREGNLVVNIGSGGPASIG